MSHHDARHVSADIGGSSRAHVREHFAHRERQGARVPQQVVAPAPDHARQVEARVVIDRERVYVHAPSLRFEHRVAHTAPLALDGLERAVTAFEQQLDIERRAPSEQQDDSAGKLALARAISGPEGRDSELVRITSERAGRRWSPVHIAARVAQCDALGQQLADLHAELSRIAAHVMAQARAHDWLPPLQRDRIEAVHNTRCAAVAGWLQRLQAAREGFASLPVDEALRAEAPAPIAWETP